MTTDPCSPLRTVCDDVKDVWRRAMGSELVLKKREEGDVQEAA